MNDTVVREVTQTNQLQGPPSFRVVVPRDSRLPVLVASHGSSWVLRRREPVRFAWNAQPTQRAVLVDVEGCAVGPGYRDHHLGCGVSVQLEGGKKIQMRRSEQINEKITENTLAPSQRIEVPRYQHKGKPTDCAPEACH